MVISQLLDTSLQQFKEQITASNLDAPNCGVDSDCFSEKLRIWSKTQIFCVTELLSGGVSVTVSVMISMIVSAMVSIVVSVRRGEFTCGKAYMAPCTVLQVIPSMELRVSATSLARSAREARVPSTWGWEAVRHGDW
mgnify:CR=1 FL=1